MVLQKLLNGVSKRTIQFILDPKKLEDNRILEKKKLK
jgi:hypothetical protein